MLLRVGLALLLASVASGDDFEDVQSEFLLPYSVTEDVDFSIPRPGSFGCWQWSTNNTDVIKLDPIFVDFDRQCGNRLEFQILPGATKGEKTVIKLTAENIEVADGYDSDSAPASFDYILRVHPLASMEVLGLKTQLTAGSDPQPFGITGYDDEENEFDTLDGLQISWYIGAKREVAIYERHRQAGPIVKVVPLRAGHGAVIAVLTDPNYEHIEPAVMDFEVSAPLFLEPDGPYLLEGAKVDFKLKEKGINAEGKEQESYLNVTGENPLYTLELMKEEGEEEVATIDEKTRTVTGVREGETTLLVRSVDDNEVVRQSPVRVTTAASLTVQERENPDHKQLILGMEYDIDIVVADPDGRKIYPSENILCKTTFPKQFEVVEIAENGLTAKVRAVAVGIGKIKASLRSVLTDDDEELEIVPHVKGSTDFEVYESVVIKPRETILPWDENTKPSYELKYTATGGGQVYSFSVDREDLATADSEGKVTTHGGPGAFTVTASMVKGDHNYDQAKVYLQPVTELHFKEGIHLETALGTPLTLGLRMLTTLAADADPVLFTDCADVPYMVALSDNRNFELNSEASRGHNRMFDACTSFDVKALTPGTTTKVTVNYNEPTTSRMLKDSVHISAYRHLEIIHPHREKGARRHESGLDEILLPVGGQTVAVLRGGPTPWLSKPSAHFTQTEVEDPTVARVTRIPAESLQPPVVTGAYSDVFAFTITCMDVGNTTFSFTVGNTASSTNKNPIQTTRELLVTCDVPTKLTVNVEPKRAEGDNASYAVNNKNSRILAHNYRDVLLRLNVKNSKGQTFNDISSLKFDFKVSDNSLLKQSSPSLTVTKIPVGDGKEFGTVSYPGRAYQSFTPASKDGIVDITATLVGYDENLLQQRKVKTTPPAIPRVPDDDEDIEDEEEFSMHAHHLRAEVELQMAKEAEVNKARKDTV